MKKLTDKYIKRIKIDYPEDDKLMMDLQDFAKEITEQLSLYSVSHQKEQLLAYEQSKMPKTWWMSKSQVEGEIDYYLANN